MSLANRRLPPRAAQCVGTANELSISPTAQLKIAHLTSGSRTATNARDRGTPRDRERLDQTFPHPRRLAAALDDFAWPPTPVRPPAATGLVTTRPVPASTNAAKRPVSVELNGTGRKH